VHVLPPQSTPKYENLRRWKERRSTYKLLLKICSFKKKGEMDELKMVPVNIFLPRSASIPVLSSFSTSHLRQSREREERKFQAALILQQYTRHL